MMKGAPKRILRRDCLWIVQDQSKVHTSKMTKGFLKEQELRFLLLPGNSLDLNLIENCFGLVKKKLDRQPTRDLVQLKKQVVRL